MSRTVKVWAALVLAAASTLGVGCMRPKEHERDVRVPKSGLPRVSSTR